MMTSLLVLLTPEHVIDDAIEAIEHMAEPVHFDADLRPQDLDAASR